MHSTPVRLMDKLKNLIHVGCFFGPYAKVTYLFLREVNPHTFTWYEQAGPEAEEDTETATALSAPTIEEALRIANYNLKSVDFRTINCGFRYTLPERDEHGINALFYQMIASYSSSNGVYFDEEIGCNCFVQNASEEARNLWKQLKANEKK